MEEGTRAARFYLLLGVVMSAALVTVGFLPGMSLDNSSYVLILLTGAFGYIALAGAYQPRWRFSELRVMKDGFLAPRRSMIAAVRGRPGRLVRWDEVANARVLRNRPQSPERVLAVRTKSGWLHYIRETEGGAAFSELMAALRDRTPFGPPLSDGDQGILGPSPKTPVHFQRPP
jgi:hypothetical protein